MKCFIHTALESIAFRADFVLVGIAADVAHTRRVVDDSPDIAAPRHKNQEKVWVSPREQSRKRLLALKRMNQNGCCDQNDFRSIEYADQFRSDDSRKASFFHTPYIRFSDTITSLCVL